MKYCPICKNNFNSFMPFGIVSRKDALCDNCKSLERHRLAWLYYQNSTNMFDGKVKSILHIAPEQCISSKLKSMPEIEYVSIDLLSKNADTAMDLTNIDFKNNMYDIILCSHVLEHIENDLLAMKEIYRVLKPRGWASIQVPIYDHDTYEDINIKDPKDRLSHFDQEDHVRKYGLDIAKRLGSVGFAVIHDRYADKFNEYQKDLYSINVDKYKDIFICTKGDK